MLYTLKMHIGLVRGRLDARAAEHAAERAKGRAGPR
jgi:hypothetical protein